MPSVSNSPKSAAGWVRSALAPLAVALSLGLLQGCAVVVLAGAATGAAVVHDRRPAARVLADDTIELQAMELLHKHPDIGKHSNISINSYNLTVLLTGQAESREIGARFADLVARLPKVAKVVNEVTVGPDAGITDISKDVYLASRAKFALTGVKISGFDPLRVHVVVTAGTVYLLGLVTQAEGTAAAEQVRYVPGVTKVVKLFETIQGPA